MKNTTETIEVMGMTCVGCARTLENEFRKFEDIDFVVDFAGKSITVRYCPDKHKREDFENAIESHGYKIKGKAN